jgi:cation diffusion facilitator family transporter
MGEADRASARPQGEHEKQVVAVSSLLAAVILTSLKIAVGLATGSLGILSEAAHSGLDMVAAAVTFLAVRISAKPADREHTYGHGKVENLSALFETMLLLATCIWIIHEAVERLFFRSVPVQPSVWGFVVMGVSIAIDYSRSRALARVAKKYRSQALEADALHFSTDIWSSAVVIAGLGCVSLSKAFSLPWLEKADALAALLVAGIVVFVSARLGKRSIDELLDAIPAGAQDQVARAARVAGVLDVRKVRLRRSGPEVFADVTLTVSRDQALERAHDIASDAEAAIKQDLPDADVVVHLEPVDPGNVGLLTTVRLLAARHGMGAHAMRVYEAERLCLELHLEVDEKLRLDEAHALADEFERALRGEVPALGRVITHIEPRGEASATRRAAPEDELPVRRALEEIEAERGVCLAPHEISAQRVGGELSISFHCTLDSRISIAEAHALTEQVEKDLRARLPNLGRVLIHVEPPEELGAKTLH